MNSYCAALGAGYANLGNVPSEAAVSTAILTHSYLPRPAGPVVRRSEITNLAQVRDYGRAGFHATVDAYDRAPGTAPIEPFVRAATTYALVAKRADLVAQYDYGSRASQYDSLRSELVADLATADAAASQAMKYAPAPASAPAPSNVIRLPTAPAPEPPKPPASVSTAGIGTAKGLLIAGGVGLVAYALFKRKKAA